MERWLDGSYSVSDIQGYIEHIINKHQTLSTNLLFIFTLVVLIID